MAVRKVWVLQSNTGRIMGVYETYNDARIAMTTSTDRVTETNLYRPIR